ATMSFAYWMARLESKAGGEVDADDGEGTSMAAATDVAATSVGRVAALFSFESFEHATRALRKTRQQSFLLFMNACELLAPASGLDAQTTRSQYLKRKAPAWVRQKCTCY